MFSCIVRTVWEVMKEQARLISYYPHGFPTTRTPILLSRFVNLEAFTVPALALGHTMPAIAYTSGIPFAGLNPLPSAAERGSRSAIPDLYSAFKVRPAAVPPTP